MKIDNNVLLFQTVGDKNLYYGYVNYLLQYTADYKSIPYGSGNLYKSGCGFFSVCQYYQLVTGKNLTLDDIKIISDKDNSISDVNDTNYTWLIKIGGILGLDISENKNSNIDTISEALTNNKSVVFW